MSDSLYVIDVGRVLLEDAIAKWKEHDAQVKAHEAKAREHDAAKRECERVARDIGKLREKYAVAIARHLGQESAFLRARDEAATAVAIDGDSRPPTSNDGGRSP